MLFMGPVCAQAEDPPTDPCASQAGQVRGLDRLQRDVFTSVCGTARFFDGLFGDTRSYADDYRETYGRIGLGLSWDDLEEFRLDGNARFNLHLPVLGERFNAVIGRESEETYVDDTFEEYDYLPGSFSDDGEQEWYAGINYIADEGRRSSFNVGAGIGLQSPLNPYLRARYRYRLLATDDVLVTLRATPFWEREDGVGMTVGADADWSWNDRELLRWTNTLTRSEVTEGIRWRSRLAYHHGLSGRSAVRIEAAVRGETDGIEPDLRELKLTYRRSFLREWLFIEAYGGAFWADDERPERRCSGCALAGIGFDLMFGQRYGQAVSGSSVSGVTEEPQ